MTGPAPDDEQVAVEQVDEAGDTGAALYGRRGYAILHPDPKIRDKARRYVDGQLPDLPPAVGE